MRLVFALMVCLLLSANFAQGFVATKALKCLARLKNHRELRGPIPEFHQDGRIVLMLDETYTRGWPGMIDTQKKILQKLNPGSKVLIVWPKGNKKMTLEKYFGEDLKLDQRSIDVEYFHAPKAEGIWARDSFPVPIIDPEGKVRLVEFDDGNKSISNRSGPYKELAKKKGFSYASSKLGLPLGALVVDGKKAYVSELVRDHNSAFGDEQKIVAEIKEKLNVEDVEFLPGLAGEKTEHLDLYMKFISEDTLLLADSEVPEQKSMLDQLEKKFLSEEKKVFRIPNATNNEDTKGAIYTSTKPFVLATLSYINFFQVGDKVYIPKYGVSGDQRAKNAFVKAGFKPENIIQINASELITKEGSVHCVTAILPE